MIQPAAGWSRALASRFERDESGVLVSAQQGYWSNLTKEENRRLVDTLRTGSARAAIRTAHPAFEDVIYSPKRAGCLELLGLQGHESCIDFGWMWGALTIPLAKLIADVLAIDQTLPSQQFLSARAREEGLSNITPLCHDLRTLPELPVKADVAIVNGVLEWVGEEEPVELDAYFAKRQARRFTPRPGERQREFLQTVCGALKPGGRRHLAIENRYDFKMFLGGPDPHIGLPFTTLLPRRAADWVSRALLRRPYVTWIYSFAALCRLLEEVGFGQVSLYICFPDYRYPDRILPYEQPLDEYELTIRARNAAGVRTAKRAFARTGEFLLMKLLRAKALSPSIIAIAHR